MVGRAVRQAEPPFFVAVTQAADASARDEDPIPQPLLARLAIYGERMPMEELWHSDA